MTNSSIQCSWSEAKRVLARGHGGSSGGEIRTWADKLNGDSGNTFNPKLTESGLHHVERGDHGICRYRTLPLHRELGNQESIAAAILFGDMYTVLSVSASGRWLEVASVNGYRGWMPREKHFALARSDFDSLSILPKADVLTFLVDAIHRG